MWIVSRAERVPQANTTRDVSAAPQLMRAKRRHASAEEATKICIFKRFSGSPFQRERRARDAAKCVEGADIICGKFCYALDEVFRQRLHRARALPSPAQPPLGVCGYAF